ncbi:MAG: hypothetical protein ABI592_03745 [Acidobacteriota bacterium]
MIPSAARAFERLFGAGLQPAAAALRAAALAMLLVAVTLALVRLGRAVAARRFGWETASVVRCVVCGGVASDPVLPFCPSGHPVRFPPGARALQGNSGRAGNRGWLAAAAAVQALLAFGAVSGARSFRVTDASAPPLAALAGSAGYLFLTGALLAAGAAAAPSARGILARGLAGVLAAAALVPALTLLFFARVADPPPHVALGSLWETPTALYVESGGRPRREADAPAPIEAEIVEIRSPLFGVQWEGLASLRTGGRTIPWRGSGGWNARVARRWPAALSGVVLATRSRVVAVETPPNVRLWVFRGPDGITFSSAGEGPAAATPDARPDRD